MEAPIQDPRPLSRILSLVSASPYWFFLVLCSLATVLTRIRTGYVKSKLQNQTETPSKDIPILPYWLPYLGHGPAFGWDFDGLLAKGR